MKISEDQIIRVKITLGSVMALISCLFACAYNEINRIAYLHQAALSNIANEFPKFEWWAFLMPLLGFLSAIFFRKLSAWTLTVFFPEILLLFSLFWALIAILVWAIQAIPVHL